MTIAMHKSALMDISQTYNHSAPIKPYLLLLGVLLFIPQLSYFFLEPSTLRGLAQEDGWVENISALNWLIATVVMFCLYAKERNLWFLLLGIFFAVCFGEELSWGQRVFDFSTPEFISDHNYQGEFNLHNLNLFERRHYNEQSLWSNMHDLTRLFAIFWFLYGCVLPTLLTFSSPLRRFVQKIKLPVMPLRIGVFFLLNYMVFQYFEDLHPQLCRHFGFAEQAEYASLPVELREWYESLIFMVFSIFLFKTEKRHHTKATLQPISGQ